MGVIANRRPDLYGAIVNGVPLLDMKRYTKLGAGASWIAEYGDPDTADWAYMSKQGMPARRPRRCRHSGIRASTGKIWKVATVAPRTRISSRTALRSNTRSSRGT
jgi:hypothetical protein